MYLLLVSLALAAYLASLLLEIIAQDDLCGRISNKALARGAAVALAAASANLLVSSWVQAGWPAPEFFRPALRYSFFAALAVNAGAGLVAGVALWKASFWPAGDAKLYALCCAALPLVFPFSAWSPSVLFLSLLVNIFLPPAVVYFWQVCREQLETARSQGFAALRSRAGAELAAWLRSAGGWPRKIVFFLFVMCLFSLVSAWNSAQRGVFHIDDGIFFILMLALGARAGDLAARLGARGVLAGFGALAVAATLFPAVLDLARMAGYGMTRSVQFLGVRWLVLLVVDRHACTHGVQRVALSSLAPGMIPTEDYLAQLRELRPEVMDEAGLDAYRDGLTAGQAERLRALLRHGGAEVGEEVAVPVLKVRPFAFWVGVGALLTALQSGGHLLWLAQGWAAALKAGGMP